MAALDAKQLVLQYNQMTGERSEFESHWRECYRFTYPQFGVGFDGCTSQTQVQKERADLMDSTGTDSTRILTSTLISGMTPANSQWLELKSSGDDNEEVDAWLSTCSTQVWSNIHSSNFDAEIFTATLDATIAGSFALYIDTDRIRGGLLFQQWPISECFWTSVNGNTVDTIFRRYKLTAAQAYQDFGDAAGARIKEDADKAPDTKHEFLHVIAPRKEYKQGGKSNKNMPFFSAHILVSDQHMVRESGYMEFPVMVPRINKIPGSQYATGIVSDALPDIKELNALKRMEKSAAELAVSGMWVAVDDGVLNPRTLTVGPRKIIVATDIDNIKPLLTGSDFNVAFQSEATLQASIRRTLMADQLNGGSASMTATEVTERINLIRQQQGPLFGRLNAEYLVPMVERCFMLMYRSGALPDAPDEISDVEFHVHFDNPLARAQRMQEVSAISQVFQTIEGLTPIAPDIADVFDMEGGVREISNALGVPAKLLRTQDDVTIIRNQRAEQQAAQQQQAMQQQVGMQAAQAAIQQQAQPTQ